MWRSFDRQLFLYVVLLIAFGLVLGYSANYGASGTPGVLSQTVKTVIWTLIGLTGFFVAASIDYHWLSTFTGPIYLAVLGLLALTTLIGTHLFGAQMSISVAGLDFQSSEIAKVLMIVVLASYLHRRRERIGRLSTIIGAGLVMAIPTFLVYRQPDLGFIHAEMWFSRTFIIVQYWRSMEQLLDYATNRTAQHLPAWQEFNKTVGTDGAVGIWHETYAASAGSYENVYVNMPAFGLGKAGTLQAAVAGKQSAAGRLRVDHNSR